MNELDQAGGKMPKRRTGTRQVRIGAVLGRDFMLAPMVAFMRFPLMAAEAGNAGARATETTLAINEKAAALVEGAFAAQWSLMVSATRFWPEVLSGRTPALLSGAAVERALNAALRPAGRRVRANFRRLAARS